MSPSNKQRWLSKSKLISAWQCPKKVHLEVHHPELGEVSSQTEALFRTGHDIGAIAQRLYGTAASVEIAFDRRMERMVAETRGLLDRGADFPIFEATFEHDGVLVRVDVLIPDGRGWRIVEVKASTSIKDYHVLDCAIQDWVLRNAGIDVTRVALAHVDNQFVYPGGGHYAGLLVEHDLTEAVRTLEPTVLELFEIARTAVAGDVPRTAVGPHCTKPYECQFVNHCWPMDAEYPVVGLRGSRAKLAEYVSLGCRDIRDVASEQITAETQQRIHRVTVCGEREILEGARRELAALPYPRYYLDFETIGPAVPIWPGTRPYATIPVQWSVHIDDGSGDGRPENMRHEEFLDLSGKPPMRDLAEKLIACLGQDGPVLTYTNYEEGVIRELIAMFPDLAQPLERIVARLFDLHPVVKANYYHPKMLGSWSIKAVVPTLAPHMDYAELEGIKEGTGASDGFLEAIHPSTTPERKAEIETQLLRYCKFDTEAMVEIVRCLQ